MTLKDAAMMAVNRKLILQRVDWDFYEQLLQKYQDSNEVHFAYDDGFLEVEVPLYKHESANGILRNLVTFVCVEKAIDFINAGSTTFRERAKAKGCEPDAAFYIQHEEQIRGLTDLDLRSDPPPDLVIEVDITSPSLNKMPIYAALNVPEVWLYKGDRVIFYRLEGEDYTEVQYSDALPFLDGDTANQFLIMGLSVSSSEWYKELKAWLNKSD